MPGETAPRKQKFFHLVGLPDCHKLETAPRKQKFFYLVGLPGRNKLETDLPKGKKLPSRGAAWPEQD